MIKNKVFKGILYGITLLALVFMVLTVLYYAGLWSQEKRKNEPAKQPETSQQKQAPAQSDQSAVVVSQNNQPVQPASPDVDQDDVVTTPPLLEVSPKGFLETVVDGVNELITIKIGG